MGPSCIKDQFFVIDLMTCYVYHIKLTRSSVDSNLVSKLIIHIATISIIWVLFLTIGHTLVPYFLNYPNMVATHTVTSLQNKKKNKKHVTLWNIKPPGTHAYKNICALTCNDERKQYTSPVFRKRSRWYSASQSFFRSLADSFARGVNLLWQEGTSKSYSGTCPGVPGRRLGHWLRHCAALAFSRFIGVELDSEGSIVSTCTEKWRLEL